jgi:REP element-mobilizing transposase RayT
MVIGYHLVMTAYGWWLPNDPRGSTSRYIESDVIAELGELHFGRKRIQPTGREIRAFYDRAADVLKHPLLTFDQQVRDSIAEAFGRCIAQYHYTCYACAILQDHAHFCIRKHKHLAEDMIRNLQHTSAELVRALHLRPDGHPVWGLGGWKVFLDHPDDMWRTMSYVERNPTKHHLKPQRFPFVLPYDGWPLRKQSAGG